MYLTFFGLAEKPFSITPDPRYLYLGARHSEALAHLVYGITEAGGFIQLTGEVGTGKTTTIRSLLARAPKNAEIALIINPRLSRQEFLLTICQELGLPVPEPVASSAKEIVDLLNRHLLEAHAAGRRVVLIIDEAQNLTSGLLEQVRLLTNLETTSQKLLQIILIGQPELRELLERNDLRQLAQRVTARYHLEPLGREDAIAYVRHRLGVAGATREIFTRSALDELYRQSRGVPRVINIVADRALLAAYTKEQREVSTALVRRAASEVFDRPIAPQWLTPVLVALAVVLVAVGATWWRGETLRRAADAVAAAKRAAATAASATPQLPTTQPAPPKLATLLAQADMDTSTDAAFTQLLGLWNAQYVPGSQDGCTQAANQHLDCVSMRGSLAQLRELNRPAILMLNDPAGKSHQVVLTSVGDEIVELKIGPRAVRTSIADLARYWFGDYVLLWRPVVPVVEELRPGARGPAVRQLRTQLQQLRGDAPDSRPNAVYDDALRQMVEEFQREHHLAVDGIAGIETQLRLDVALTAPDAPVLGSLADTKKS